MVILPVNFLRQMINFNFVNYFFNNNFYLLKLRFRKIRNIKYDHDFSNLYFFDIEKVKKVLLNEYNNFNKNEDEYYNYHSFNWIKSAKNIGGANHVKITRQKILQWIIINHKFSIYFTDINILIKRIINLIYNFDFYGSSANEGDKLKIKFVIFCHYSF